MKTPRCGKCSERNSKKMASRSTCRRSNTGAKEGPMRARSVCLLIVALVLLPWESAYCAERVVLGYSGVGSGEEVHHLAKQLGLFKKYGLDVEIVYIPGGSTVVQA